MTEVKPATAQRPAGLKVTTRDVLAGLEPRRVVELEVEYGNTDLIRALDILGIAGPFTTVSPWELRDEKGRHLINAGGYAALPFGESYPPLIEFLSRFLEANRAMALPQSTAADWRAALEASLVDLLAGYAPSHDSSKVFFANSGAEAIEAAIKFARAARPRATHLINFTRGYHGKTFGALSVTANEDYQAPFRPLLSDIVTVPFGDAAALADAIERLKPDRVTAIVLEPLLGEGGVVTPPEDFLPAVEALRQKYGILVIADEIQSGLGRSGHYFASVAGGLDPDIVTLAKPLGGGLVPIGATIARDWIVKRALGGLHGKRHSTTFGGGSLAMAVGLKSLEIILEEGLADRARAMGAKGLSRLRQIQELHPSVIEDVRAAGALFAVTLHPAVRPALLPGQEELVHTLSTALAMRAFHLSGVHVCFTQNRSQTVRLTPALTMPDDLLSELFDRVEHTASRQGSAWRTLPQTPPGVLLRLAKLALGG